MDNQHRKMQGYRELSKEEIALINEAKTIARSTGAFIERIELADRLVKNIAAHGADIVTVPESLQELVADMRTGAVVVDMRWLAIAKTDLQKAHMPLVRAIARPTSF